MYYNISLTTCASIHTHTHALAPQVCLSLLGTYNSGHTSEKWNPDLSTLYQILVSVQSQILVDDPMTNEPLSETMAGTAEGAAKTAQYNARLQLMVMRHAMVDMLQHPPPGTQVCVVCCGRMCVGGRAYGNQLQPAVALRHAAVDVLAAKSGGTSMGRKEHGAGSEGRG